MFGLHHVDNPRKAPKHLLPAANDWVDLEERRRVFFMAYNMDRWASAGNGWPMMIDEEDV